MKKGVYSNMPVWKWKTLLAKRKGGMFAFDFYWKDYSEPELSTYRFSNMYADKVRQNVIFVMKKKGITTRKFDEIAISLGFKIRYPQVRYLGCDPGFKNIDIAKLYRISRVLGIENPLDLLFRDFSRDGVMINTHDKL